VFQSISKYFTSIRTWQWLKNLVVFTLPIGFGTSNLGLLLKVLQSFFGLSLLSSSVYVINDIKDISSDQNHPFKKNRPIASGKLSIKSASFFLIFLLIAGLIILLLINLNTFIVGSIYFICGFLYTYTFKYMRHIDSLIISVLFVARLLIGSFAVNIKPSLSLIIFITLFSFSLSVSKRISILLNKNISEKSRYKEFLTKSYDVEKLKNVLRMSLTLSNLVYFFWVMSKFSNFQFSISNLFLSISVLTMSRVLYGIYRLTITSGLEDFVLSIIKSKVNFSYIIFTVSLTILGIYL
tara:strand:+ start:9031 stop:9915 length:885 start_codon:yes stop_codon:yes gene_type:complete